MIAEVFDGLSLESRRRRFLVAMPRLTGRLHDALAAVDDRTHVVLVAEVMTTQPQAVGLGRYIHTSSGAAEIALEVVDAWHRRGIGRSLLRGLLAQAQAQGLDRFEGTLLPENREVLGLLRSELPLLRLRVESGLLLFDSPIRPATPMPAVA